ncbi:ANTAR domain-containing protein [Geodermatophilus saharensis]|uniref:ANTAR domain-containing protein n=1 Tax=Geodermatophilus saharensis TaxID=1137994 RepID=A0A239CND4_9ACTN|nr:GAF and ANTAR domain-containing protein [Geodermatophilus saharensis]SNS21459.1 ANTAR domain-containing protein [Geodermatophilus saharensis]
MTRPDGDPFSAALLDLGLIPLDRPLPLLLEQVADLAADVLGGRPALSVTVVGADSPRTVGTSSQVAAALDEVQYTAGEGPCVHAARTGEVAVVADTEREERWPGLATAAAAAGLRGVVSMPLPSPRPVAGGLNLYLQLPLGAGGARERAERFAHHAAVPVANGQLHARSVQLAQNLQAALESRAVIDQAKGILIERYRLTASQAFDALARVSNETNTKVRDLAAHLVDTGEFPPA